MARHLLSTGGLSVGPHQARRYLRPETSNKDPQGSEGGFGEGSGEVPASDSFIVPEDLKKIDDVVGWVKEDVHNRARPTLDAELAKNKPRKTLVFQLQELLAEDTSGDGDGDGADLL